MFILSVFDRFNMKTENFNEKSEISGTWLVRSNVSISVFHWNSPFSHGIHLKSDKLNKKTEVFQTYLVGFLIWTHYLASQFWTETFWCKLYTVWYLNLNNYLVLQCILYEILSFKVYTVYLCHIYNKNNTFTLILFSRNRLF